MSNIRSGEARVPWALAFSGDFASTPPYGPDLPPLLCGLRTLRIVAKWADCFFDCLVDIISQSVSPATPTALNQTIKSSNERRRCNSTMRTKLQRETRKKIESDELGARKTYGVKPSHQSIGKISRRWCTPVHKFVNLQIGTWSSVWGAFKCLDK
jgi:hypothetical protein